MEELAKRAVACKHWRWMAGMSDKQGFRFIGPLFEDRASTDSALPDLSDPATLGCLLHLVFMAYGRFIHVHPLGGDDMHGYAYALVNLLEIANGIEAAD